MIFSERYRQDNNLWLPDEKYNFQYSDGDDTENYILNAIQQSGDLSTGSEDLVACIRDWPTLYHLSPKRADLLRPLSEQLKGKKILEIGSGCGAITCFLGEMNCEVLALEGSPRRAKITVERCRDLDNVKVVAGNFDTFITEEKFDCITLIGVLEYSNLFIKDDNPPLAMLQRIRQLLKPGGNIIIAIENKIGLKYWAGAPEDHANKAYYGIQNLYSDAGPETFGHYEMTSLLTQAGFGISEFMYPFPDYKFADVIITDAGFKKQGFDPLELLFEKFDYFQNTWYDSQFSSTLTAHSLFNNNLLPHFANSFLITASLSPTVRSHEENQVLAYVYSTSRKKKYCKQTIFSSDPESESVSVIRQLLYETNNKSTPYLQHVLQNEPYINGQILLNRLLPIVSANGWTVEDIYKWAHTFYDVVISKSFQKDQQTWLEGKYLDLTPFNIIFANGQSYFFDLEWICDEDIPAYYIFFRGLAHSLGRIFFVNDPRQGTPLQIMQLASEITRHYFDFDNTELQDCKTREIKYFSAVALREVIEPFPITQVNVRGSAYSKLLESNKELLLQNEKLLNELQEISLLKKNINWYFNTYVNRSLAGVVKQRLSDWRRSLLKRIKRSGVYILRAGSHIEYDLETKQYSAIGINPYFQIDMNKEYLNAGWYWLDLQTNPVSSELISPKLYFNTGGEFNETDICFLPAPHNGKITALVNFHSRVYQLRFDPSVSDCRFTMGRFSLKKISKINALLKTVKIYRKTFPDRTPWSIAKELFLTLKKHGFSGLRKQIRRMSGVNIKDRVTPYMKWYSRYDTLLPSEIELLQKCSKELRYQPFFSIVMPVYNPPLIYLRKAIDSVINQPYPNWELCIADDFSANKKVKELLSEYAKKDKRIKVIYRNANGHISEASNSALQIAEGEFIVLVDQDDELSAHALYLVAEAINKNPDAALLYSDEDKIDEEGNRFDPYFKTDWNPDLFLGQNMISHLGVYKASIVNEIGGFRKGFEGSQDYDLALRFIQKIKPSQIIHIPHVLYHWRAISGSTAAGMSNKNYAFTAGLKALESFIHDQNLNAQVLPNVYNSYRIKWNLPFSPKVSIIIPTRDKAEILSLCVNSILEKTKYSDYELIIIDNNSAEEEAIELFSYFCKKDSRVSVLQYTGSFNFSAIINYGVSKCSGEILVLLNNDTQVINEDWLEELVSHALRNNVGAVGAKLLYPNGLIQHAGIILYEEHPGIHIYQKSNNNEPGYVNKLNLVQNYNAVTAACLAVKRELFELVGGLDEKNLPVAYNDVDFCLKLRERGFYNVWTPFSLLYHHEFLSRGDDLNERNIERFKKEHSYMLNKWQKFISNDSYFNPNLSPKIRATAYAYPPKVFYSWRRKDLYNGQNPDRLTKYESAADSKYDVKKNYRPLTPHHKISILLIAKDEHPYLEEFICYYLVLGVDHFYIYDNGSEIPVAQTLKQYLKHCNIIDFPGRAKQLEAYNHFIKHYSHETEWVVPIDIDEFIVLRQDQNIKDFLMKYSHIDCIALNWKYFGDNFFDKRPEGLVMDNFILCDEIQNPHIKNIVKTSVWEDCENAHYLGLKPGSIYSDVKGNIIAGPLNENYTIDVVQINHYCCKSKEDCYLKYEKGRASVAEKFNLSEELFQSWRNLLNLAEDTFLRDKFSKKVKAMMKKHQKDDQHFATYLLPGISK